MKQMVLWEDEWDDGGDLITRLVTLVDDLNEVLDELDRVLGRDGE